MTDLRLVSLSEVLKMGVGEPVPRTKGTITKIYPRKSGTSVQGEWSFENFVLNDGGVEVTCKLKGQPPMDQSLRGKSVWLISSSGPKGITGLKIDEYEGKKQILITPSATIAVNDGTQPKSPEAPVSAPEQPSKYIPMGQTIGMAINNACHNLTYRHLPLDPKEVTRIASDLLRVSKWLEDGNLMPKGETPDPSGVRCLKCEKIVPEVGDTGECPECTDQVPF